MSAERSQRESMMKQSMRERFEKQAIQEQRARAFERQQKRYWETGDIYSPHDLSPAEMMKWKKKKSPSTDAFDALSLNPLHLYKVCRFRALEYYIANPVLSVFFFIFMPLIVELNVF